MHKHFQGLLSEAVKIVIFLWFEQCFIYTIHVGGGGGGGMSSSSKSGLPSINLDASAHHFSNHSFPYLHSLIKVP